MERLDSLLDAVRGVSASLPDKRRGLNRHYTMADIGMAAFSVFFMQCPSFLAHQRALLDGQGRSNSQTLFKMTEIPSDNHIRDMLDPIDPSLFHPLFDKAVATLDESGGLDAMRCLGGPNLEGSAFKGHVLIALDGTEYHRSTKVRCARCSTMTKGTKTDYFHAMVQAAIVAPGHNRAVPLRPAFIEPQDGHENKTAKAAPAAAGLPCMARPPRPSSPSISATIFIPNSRFARPRARPVGISSSCASRTPIRP